MFKSGFISILGKPNAGKSTLTNTLVGEKVSIVTWKPQTTRNKIIGIVNGEGYQVVLVDTPGIHKAKNELSKFMMKSVESAREGVDGYVYMLACDKRFDEFDRDYIIKLAGTGKPLYVVVNKCDEVEEIAVMARIEALKDIEGITAILPISALKGKNCDLLLEQIVKNLSEGEQFFAEDMYTDKSVRFMVSEIVREKALKNLSDEIPYGIGVAVNKFAYREDGIIDIDCDIICEKQAHKAMVIGKNGDMIKKISTYSRMDMEELLQAKVFLTLYVRVKESWRDSDLMLNELGYSVKDLK